MPKAADTALLKLARERFKQAQDADNNQKQRELDDLRFYAGDQWPEDVRTARAGQQANGGMPPVPARPCETVNKLREPVRQVLNQERQMDMGVEIVPADDFGELTDGDDTRVENEIKLREGLVRRIQRDSSAKSARTWAFERAVEAGRGYYRVNTRYLPGKTWDQEVIVSRIYNQNSVSLDPTHEEPDGSDAEWGFIGADLAKDRFDAEFPESDIVGIDEDDFRALGEDYPGWFSTDGQTLGVRVVEYFRTVRKPRTLVLLEDGSSAWKDELTDGMTPKDERIVIDTTIKWAKINGCEVLEETEWPSPYIPIVKVVGEELQPYDEERRAEGMVRPARSSQFGLNVMISKLLELIGLTPIPPILMAAGQDEGFEPEWDASTTRTIGRLHYNQNDSEGRVAPPPFATPRDAPIGPVAQALGFYNESITSTTGVPDLTRQNLGSHVKSKAAMQLLVEAGMKGTSNFLDNLARSIRYEGQIINSLLYPIYGRPGRIARILNAEGEPESMPVKAPMPPGQSAPQDHYALTPDAQFNVAIKVSKAFDTRREQESETVGSLIDSNPALMGVLGDLFFKNLDGPGHEEMAERVKATLDPRVLAAMQAKDQNQTPIPPEIQAQVQQMQAQMQQMGQELQEAKSGIAVAQLKAQADLQIAQLRAQTDVQLAQMKEQADLAKTQATIDQKNAALVIETETKRLQAVLGDKGSQTEALVNAQHRRADHAHELLQTSMQHAHEQQQAERQAEAQAGQTAAQQAHEAEMAANQEPTV